MLGLFKVITRSSIIYDGTVKIFGVALGQANALQHKRELSMKFTFEDEILKCLEDWSSIG